MNSIMILALVLAILGLSILFGWLAWFTSTPEQLEKAAKRQLKRENKYVLKQVEKMLLNDSIKEIKLVK